MELIYKDDRIIAINKPSGIESVPSHNKGRSATELLLDEVDCAKIIPVHRLDRDTTGTLVFAQDETTQKALESLFKERKTSKNYLAICAGVPRNTEGVIRRNLSKWSGGHKPVRVVKGGGGLTAQTEYKVLCSNKTAGASLILFTPHQGRTHQIRVHAEAFGRPVAGDHQYGDREFNKQLKALTGLKRQALHAWRLTLPGMNKDNTDLTIIAPIPKDMEDTCNKLFPDWQNTLEKE